MDDNMTYCPKCNANKDDGKVNASLQYGNQAPAQNSYQFQPFYQEAPKKGTNGWGIFALIFALISIPFNSLYFVPGALGLIFGIIGLGCKKRYSSCNGCAVAGFVISVVFLAFWLLEYFAPASLFITF